MRTCIIAAVISAAVGWSSLAQEQAPPAQRERIPAAGERGGPPGRGLDGIARHLTRALSLTEEQQAEVKSIAAEFRDARAQNGPSEEAAALREELLAARDSGDTERVKELRQEMRELRGDAVRGALDEFFTQVEAVLDEEQVAKLAGVREQMAQRRSHRHADKEQGDGPRPGKAKAAGPRRPAADEGPGSGLQRLAHVLKRLDLDEEQQASVQATLDDARQQLQEIERQVREARAAVLEDIRTQIAESLDSDQAAELEQMLSTERPGRRHGPGSGRPGMRHGAPDRPEPPVE